MADRDPLLLDEDLRRWRQCARRLWLHHRAPGAATPRATQAERADASLTGGPAPGEALQASWPGARVISAVDAPRDSAAFWPAALQRTAHALAADPPRPLIGACLVDAAQGLVVRIDLMVPGPRGWRLVRVRHATVGDEIDVDHLVLWAELLERQGVPVSALTLALVDTDFIYPGHGLYAGLYREVDLTEARPARAGWNWPAEMRVLLSGPDPGTPCGSQCHRPERCPCLDHCSAGAPSDDPAPPVDPTVSLEIFGREQAARLRETGCRTALDVPPAALTAPRHRRAWQAVHARHLVVAPGARDVLAVQPGPRHFLRFETIGFAVPPWAGTRPYQVLPFQWSCATEHTPGAPRREAHFLAGPRDGDPRRAFALSLLEALGSCGAVLAYNAGFERNRLRELAIACPDLGAALEALQPRIVDLFQLAREHLYHPAMAGSWSARSVFDAIAPELGCGRFEVLGSLSPLAAFARSLGRGLDAHGIATLQAALIDHGRRQTLALVRLTAALETGQVAAP